MYKVVHDKYMTWLWCGIVGVSRFFSGLKDYLDVNIQCCLILEVFSLGWLEGKKLDEGIFSLFLK